MNNTMKKNFLMAALFVSSSTMAYAAGSQGQGTVTFEGSIVDAPCSISADSVDQSIELGQVSNSLLKKGGKSTPRNFTIALENCEIQDDKKTVAITFTGSKSNIAGHDGMLGISGEAAGASVAITDAGGNLIPLGTKSPATDIMVTDTNMRFAAYLQGSTASDVVVVPGNFTAIADFTMAYQ